VSVYDPLQSSKRQTPWDGSSSSLFKKVAPPTVTMALRLLPKPWQKSLRFVKGRVQLGAPGENLFCTQSGHKARTYIFSLFRPIRDPGKNRWQKSLAKIAPSASRRRFTKGRFLYVGTRGWDFGQAPHPRVDQVHRARRDACVGPRPLRGGCGCPASPNNFPARRIGCSMPNGQRRILPLDCLERRRNPRLLESKISFIRRSC
jgi:hypothetical protein